jgi:LL-diaminopimelate aminotransferase
MIAIYQRRRDLMIEALQKCGLEPRTPQATFYIWIEVPKGYTSADFATRLLTELGVVVTPGNGFGEFGEGYIRMSITSSEEQIEEAGKRLARLKF